MGIANKGGRPLKFKSPEELQEKIDAYYVWAKDNGKHITITGLAWYLDTNRLTLLRYEEDDCELLKSVDDTVKSEFRNTIKRAKARIEMESEERLYKKDSVVGSIFTMKNNYGYVDKQEQVIESKTIDVTLED
ncbi:DNA-packaging protein [Clostridium sp. SHJSY1]|uniref:terminase small subunit n=1 Tax=Clostridium sp. SHJSY1 TaxID=2942483 RepID=UPI002876B65D|nr:terminase small subunit [Clostridium sp. SHJSY1]MDS0525471.1 DNA-packaging protein [Clostridium sp. SHJSY1]